MYLAIKHFCHFIEGSPLTVHTDHRPLTFALSKKVDNDWTPRQQRYFSFIAEFATSINFIQGADNISADTLSRHTLSSIDFAAMATAQSTDPQLQHYLVSKTTALRLRTIIPDDGDVALTCDTAHGRCRPFVPRQFRRAVFDKIHGLSHPGVAASRKLISERFVWPGMAKDIQSWSRCCVHCQRSKIHRHTHSEPQSFPPDHRFGTVHVDIVGPLPSSQGYSYLLTCVDRFSRWPEAILLRDITTKTVATAFINGWISRFGVPRYLVSDRGSQFQSQLWGEICDMLGVLRRKTTAYHPASNGMVERFHRQLKNSLKAAISVSGANWSSSLSEVMLGLRSAVKLDSQFSAAQMLYGVPLRLPGDYFSPPSTKIATDPADFVNQHRLRMARLCFPAQRTRSSPVHVDANLSTATHVWVRHDHSRPPLSAPYDGPFLVLERNPKYFIINKNGARYSVSIDRLKPVFMEVL
jgi:cleavage and polyadenylation specificity factor subunit 1